MFNQFKRLIIGKPKRNRELKNEKISKFKALAILSSDALSSVAYGPEQILLTLSIVGAAAAWYTLPIAVAVLILLAALTLSYRQIIYAYPKGGGAIWYRNLIWEKNGAYSQVALCLSIIY